MVNTYEAREDLHGLSLDDIYSLFIYYDRKAEDYIVKAYNVKKGGDAYNNHIYNCERFRKKANKVWDIYMELKEN